jgi:hypothetical protein
MDSSFVINPAITPYTRGGGGLKVGLLQKRETKVLVLT